MANSDAAFGLMPVAYLSGAPYNGAFNTYYIPSTDATAVYVGGLVKLAGGADANGVPTVTGNVSASNAVVGVVVGFDQVTGVTTPNLDITYRPASTAMYVRVADDPNLVFEVQEDGDTTPIAAASVGLNATLTGFTSGSTVTGRSSIEIDSDTVAVTATLDVQVLRLAQRPDNVIGAYAKWLVRLNDHQYINQTTGIS